MDSVGSVGQASQTGIRQYTSSGVLNDPVNGQTNGQVSNPMNTQSNERFAAFDVDAIRPLLMQLIAMLGNSPVSSNNNNSNNSNMGNTGTTGFESPTATQIGDGLQSNLVDNTPFVGSTAVNRGNSNSNVAGSVNNNPPRSTSNFGAPIASQLDGGIQSLLGNSASSFGGNNNADNSNPSHWRRGSAGSSSFRF